MVEIQLSYEGELRCLAQHMPSGREISTDAPVDNHGRGESFSPTDLLATSLGACMLTIMAIAGEKHGWDLGGARARVEKHMVADPARRVGRLDVEIHVPHSLDSKAQRILERAAHSCPVHRSLHPDVDVALSLRFGD